MTVADPCDSCLSSKVLCDCCKYLDGGLPCCAQCTHVDPPLRPPPQDTTTR